jgi:hypothetical protein
MPRLKHAADSPLRAWALVTQTATRLCAGAMQNVCRWYGDLTSVRRSDKCSAKITKDRGAGDPPAVIGLHRPVEPLRRRRTSFHPQRCRVRSISFQVRRPCSRRGTAGRSAP